jgi:hypothetical protein
VLLTGSAVMRTPASSGWPPPGLVPKLVGPDAAPRPNGPVRLEKVSTELPPAMLPPAAAPPGVPVLSRESPEEEPGAWRAD